MAEKSATRGASVLCALVVSFVVSFASQAAFVDFVVTNIDIDHEGTPLTVYTVAARFDGPQDGPQDGPSPQKPHWPPYKHSTVTLA